MAFTEEANIAIHAINENGQGLAELIVITTGDKFSNKYFSKNFTTAEKAELKTKYTEKRLAVIAAANSLPVLP